MKMLWVAKDEEGASSIQETVLKLYNHMLSLVLKQMTKAQNNFGLNIVNIVNNVQRLLLKNINIVEQKWK